MRQYASAVPGRYTNTMKVTRSLVGLCAGAVLACCAPGSQDTENALRGQAAVGKPIPESVLVRIMERN